MMGPETLFDLCLEIGCHIDASEYVHLPAILKGRLLTKLTKRGLCTDRSLVSLVHRHLVSIDLRECSVSEDSLLSVGELRELKCLFLPQPPSVSSNAYTEAGLVKIVKGKRGLLSLGMSGLSGVSDRVVSVLVGGSPDIVELHLQETPISNKALFCIANLSSLQCLNIAKTKVNDAGVKQLASGSAAQSLLELRLDGCSLITNKSIQTLCQLMTQLNILYFHLCPNMSAEDSGVLLEKLSQKGIKQLTWTIY